MVGCRLVGTDIQTPGVFGGKRNQPTYRRVQLSVGVHHSGKQHVIPAIESTSTCEDTSPATKVYSRGVRENRVADG